MMFLHVMNGAVSEPLSQAAGSDGLTYAECLEILDDPDDFVMGEADCEATHPNPVGPIVQRAVPLVLFAGLGITFFVMRKVSQRAAMADPTVENENAARVGGFDPLAKCVIGDRWRPQGWGGVETSAPTGPSGSWGGRSFDGEDRCVHLAFHRLLRPGQQKRPCEQGLRLCPRGDLNPHTLNGH